jgi:hypothetical protein
MNDEDLIEAVYDAALEYIYSIVPSKRIEDLDIVVSIDEAEVAIDIRLITDRSVEIDQKTVEEAVKVASEKADALMGKYRK